LSVTYGTDRWFFPCSPVSSTNKTDQHDIPVADILLIVALNTKVYAEL